MANRAASRARNRKTAHPLTIIPATIVDTRWLTPRFRRLTIWSDDLGEFIRTDAPDQFVTIVFPRPGQELIALSNPFDWQQFYALPNEVRPVARNYTVRQYDADRQSIAVDILIHGGPGLGEHWASNVMPGAPVFLWGPRVAYDPDPDAERHFLCCDECGLPAAAAIIEALPEHVSGTVIAEIKNSASEQLLPHRPNLEIHWIYTDPIDPGESLALLRAIRDLPVPGGRIYAWGGGEMESMRSIGRHVRRSWGLRTGSISATAYWRKGVMAPD